MKVAAAQKEVIQETPAITLEQLIDRAVKVFGDTWNRSIPQGTRDYDIVTIGPALDEHTLVLELRGNKTIARTEAGKRKEFAGHTPFTEVWKMIRAAQKRPTPQPRKQYVNGLVTLHELGRPFDWVDLVNVLDLVPLHAKNMIYQLRSIKKIERIPDTNKYLVVTANSPELFPPSSVKVAIATDDKPERDEYNAEWLDAKHALEDEAWREYWMDAQTARNAGVL